MSRYIIKCYENKCIDVNYILIDVELSDTLSHIGLYSMGQNKRNFFQIENS